MGQLLEYSKSSFCVSRNFVCVCFERRAGVRQHSQQFTFIPYIISVVCCCSMANVSHITTNILVTFWKETVTCVRDEGVMYYSSVGEYFDVGYANEGNP